MVARLDFGLLRPLDLSPAIQAFQNARQMRMQEDQQKQQGALMQQRIDARQQEVDRERLTGDAVAQWFESQAGGDSAPSTPAAAPMQAVPTSAPAMAPAAATAPAQPEMGAMPGDEPMQTAPAAPDRPNPMRFLADIARKGGPEGARLAMQLFDRSRTMSKEEREQSVGAYDAMTAATASLVAVPYEQRRAALVNMAPALVASGVPANMIESFDPTDEALTAARNRALGIKGVLEVEERAVDNARAEREFDYRQRNDATNRAVTIRGQNMTDRRAAQRNQVDAQGNVIKLTEGQGKATGFLRLAEQAERTLQNVGGANAVPGEFARGAYGVPFVERLVGGGDRQVLAAQEAFTEASLRFLTGAAVTRDEARRNVSQFFPTPGDTPEVIQQKGAYRQQVMAGMRDAAGPGARRVAADNAAPPAPRSAAPPRGQTVRISNDAEYDRLASGTSFIGPDGRRRVKP